MCIPCRNPFKEAEKAVKAANIAMRQYRDSQQLEYLTAAIDHYHHAYDTSNERHNQYPDIIINYTALLNKQDRLSGEKSNLEEMIRLLEVGRAVMETRTRTEKYGVLLNNLGQAYLDRYRISKTSQDLKSATDTYEQARSQNKSSPVSLPYSLSLIGSASALWTSCELQPPAATDVEQLNSAVDFLKAAQGQSDVDVQAECYRHLASVYDLLYKRTKNHKDLDFSIDYYSRVFYMLHPQSPNRAPTLLNLVKQHFERHTMPNTQPDLAAAQRYKDEAQRLVGQVPEADELKKKIDDLTRNMEFYAMRGQTYSSVSSEGSGDAPASRQGKMPPLTEEPDPLTIPGPFQSESSSMPRQAPLPPNHKSEIISKTDGEKNVLSLHSVLEQRLGTERS